MTIEKCDFICGLAKSFKHAPCHHPRAKRTEIRLKLFPRKPNVPSLYKKPFIFPVKYADLLVLV
jgi:hypothetical protein